MSNPPDVPVVLWLSVGNVQLVSVPLAGVPSAMLAPKLVSEDDVTPLASDTPVSVDASAVTVMFAEPLKLVPLIVRAVVSVAALPVVDWLSVGKVQFARFPLVGVPRIGVMNVADVELSNSATPVPFSSLKTPRNCADVVAANCESGFATSASPPPAMVCQVLSNRRNFPAAPPVPSRAGATVPLARLLAFSDVRLAPEIAGSAPVRFADVRFVSADPLP